MVRELGNSLRDEAGSHPDGGRVAPIAVADMSDADM